MASPLPETADATSAPVAVAYLARDLFFGVRIAEGLRRLGMAARQVSRGDGAEAIAGCAALLVDLSLPPDTWRPLIVAARGAGMPVLAFGSHMDLERRRLASEAGADRVVANSRLVEHFAKLVQRLVAGSSSSEDIKSGKDPH